MIDVMTVILVLSRNTVTSLAHHGTVPHLRLDCFYSNKNKFVQIEDTKIKMNAAAKCSAPNERESCITAV